MKFVYSSHVEAPSEEVFEWHGRPGAFQRLVPPWQAVRVLELTGGITDGSRVYLRIGRRPFTVDWVALHQEYIYGRQFVDVALRSPFARWRHLHRFIPEGSSRCTVSDEIDFEPPGGGAGQFLFGGSLRRRLEQLFHYRHTTLRHDLFRQTRFPAGRPWRVVVSGASGLVGRELCAFLSTGGHRVERLVRRPPRSDDEIYWKPSAGEIDAGSLEGADAVVHLAGESLFGRWSGEKKRKIRDSRVEGTRILCEALARLERKPSVLVSASAIGYFGDRGDTPLTEQDAPGEGFLAEVCGQWEAETEPARQAGIRVVNLRIGIVLSSRGGALAAMRLPFSLGLGAKLGHGRQYFSWIEMDDLCGAVGFALRHEPLSGPVNATAPSPVTNRELTRTLARVLSRPALFRAPGAAVRGVLGEFGDNLLASVRVLPSRLERSGFRFFCPDLETALRRQLGRAVLSPASAY